jgi:hypothetical protein
VENKDETKELVISSISHDSSLFQLKFYRPITLPPKGNTSIEIVLVGRSTGAFESQIVLVTSCGSFVVELAGVMTPNPYRISPFMSVKVPVGELFEPTIVLYNPHYEVLSVKEIYTSSGFLHLQLPNEARNFSARDLELSAAVDGDKEKAKLKFWDLAPHESKSVISLRFISHKSGKYQDTVTIQTNFDELMIHVDVSVVSGSLHKMPEELDFGVLTLQDTKYLNLSLLNSGYTTLQVTDLHVTGSADPNLAIELFPSILPPNHQSAVASLAYHARSEGIFKGKLLLRTNDTNPVNTQTLISYRVRVLSGYISYPSAQTNFPAFDSHVNKKGQLVKVDALPPTTQELVLTNKFSVPLVLYSAEIDDTQLRVVNFVPSQQAEPGESWPALTIEFRPKLAHLQLFTTHLHLITNATLISIPLHIYHGKLSYTMPPETHWYSVGPLAVPNLKTSTSQVSAAPFAPTTTHVHKHAFDIQPLALSFGTVPVNEVQTRTLNLSNPNPVKVSLLGLWTDLEGLSIKLESVWNAQGYRSVADLAFKPHKPSLFEERVPSASSGSKMADQKKKQAKTSTKASGAPTEAITPAFEILPGQSVLLSLELLSTRELQAQGYIYIVTAQERSAINVTFHSLAGNLALIPDSFLFDQSPSAEIPLFLQHTYSKSIAITSITSNDERLQVHMPKSADSSIGSQDERHLWLQPHKQVAFGSASFKPIFGPKSLVQAQAESSSVVEPGVDFLSASEAEKLLKRSEELHHSQHQPLKATLTIQTDLPTTHAFPVQVQRWRPNLLAFNDALKAGVLDFGTVEVEVGERAMEIELQSPFPESSLLVQLQLSTVAHLHPASADWHASPDSSTPSCLGAFDFANAESKRLETIGPGETRRLGPLVFHPGFEGRCISTLYIRNNFSTIETLILHGVGAGGQIDFEQRSKHSSASRASASSLDVEDITDTTLSKAQELLFQVKDADLEGCEEKPPNEASSSANPSFTLANGVQKAKSADWRAPVFIQTLSVFNRGNLPLSVESVFIAPKLPPGTSSLTFSKSAATLERLETETGAAKHASSAFSSKMASKPSQGSLRGGFTVKNAEDATSAVLWPGARRFIEIAFSPDFSAAESQYDLVIRTNSSREFRFPVKGVISEQKFSACGHRFTSSLHGRQGGSFLDVRFGLIIIACLILLGLFAERHWTASNREEQLPSLHTPKASVDKASPLKNGHIHEKMEDTRSNTHRHAPEDLESHSPPSPVSSPPSAPTIPSVSKDKKKDKKEAKNKQLATNEKASQTVSKASKSKKEEKPSLPPVGDQSAVNSSKSTADSLEPKTTPSLASTPKVSLVAPVSLTSTAQVHVGSKKKEKKEKKDAWPSSSPVEPHFDAAPISPPSEGRSKGKKEPSSGTTSPNAEVPDRKRKKSLGATSAPPAGEIREPPSAYSNGSASPLVEKDVGEKKTPSAGEARQPSPPPQRTQTLVPAKRPSSKPVAKYARKDGLNKDGTPPANVLNGERLGETSQGASIPVPASTSPTVIPAKESKKHRTKEQKKAERQALLLEKGSKVEKPEKAVESGSLPVPMAKPHEAQRVLPSFGPNTPVVGHQSAWPPIPSLLPIHGVPSPLPHLQVVNPASSMYLAPPGALVSPSGPTPTSFSSPLGSSLSGDPPLLVSPGALSANRYDYGRRGQGALRASGGYGSSFDFSMAPSFDTGGLSRENSVTPPLNVGTGLQSPMRLYNPMAPQGSVENLLASLRDPELSSSEPGSVSSTPRDYAMFNQLMLGAHGASTGGSDAMMDPAWQSLTHGSIWTAPTSERAVEENVSNLSLLGLGGSPIAPHPRSISPPSNANSDASDPHISSFHHQLFPNTPSLPPGLHFAAPVTPPPPSSSQQQVDPSPPFFSSQLNSSGDLWNTTKF